MEHHLDRVRAAIVGGVQKGRNRGSGVDGAGRAGRDASAGRAARRDCRLGRADARTSAYNARRMWAGQHHGSREVCGRRTAGGKRENDWQRFGSRKPSTGWRFGQQQSVLPNVAQRSMRVSVMLVHWPKRGDGGCKLGCRGAGDGRAVGKGFKARGLPTASLHPGVFLSSPFCSSQKYACSHIYMYILCTSVHISLYIHTCINTHMHTYIPTYIHAYIHTSIHIYIHT